MLYHGAVMLIKQLPYLVKAAGVYDNTCYSEQLLFFIRQSFIVTVEVMLPNITSTAAAAFLAGRIDRGGCGIPNGIFFWISTANKWTLTSDLGMCIITEVIIIIIECVYSTTCTTATCNTLNN